MSSTISRTLKHYRFIFYVPVTHAEACKNAIFACGAGIYGDGRYTNVAFEIPGRSTFIPGPGSTPNIGQVGVVEHVDEVKIETTVKDLETLRKVQTALEKAHPYEVVVHEAFEVWEF